MYQRPNFQAYKQADMATADKGKILIMLYDHCIKWCRVAIDSAKKNEFQARTKAIFKVQDAITELICALDYEKGGDIATNLYKLYEFYNWHLSQANITNSAEKIQDVCTMLEDLRSAWVVAADQVRRQNSMNMTNHQASYVSVMG